MWFFWGRAQQLPAEPVPNFQESRIRPLIDLTRGLPDDAGYEIKDIYARKPPDYAVYRNEQRVAVQFADNATEAAAQRKMMSALNPLRGEINGLIDGWRFADRYSRSKSKARRYDRRVADALIAALEGNPEGARTFLLQVKQDIIDERTANARLYYVGAALIVGVLAMVVLAGIRRTVPFAHPEAARTLLAAAISGAFGAFFSIALAMRSRKVLLDLLWVSNTLDAGLRMVIGVVAAAVLMAMVDTRLINVGFGDLRSPPAVGANEAGPPQDDAQAVPTVAHVQADGQTVPGVLPASGGQAQDQARTAPVVTPAPANTGGTGQAEVGKQTAPDVAATSGGHAQLALVGRAVPAGDDAPGDTWLRILLIGFIAGFSERFVPDLLAKATVTAPAPGQDPPPGPNPPPEPDEPDGPARGAAPKPGGPADKQPEARVTSKTASTDSNETPSDDAEAHQDGCRDDPALAEDDATPDTHLPPASGGVRAAGGTPA